MNIKKEVKIRLTIVILGAIMVLSGNYAILAVGALPPVFSSLTILTADIYIGAKDISFECIGEVELDFDKAKNAEWKNMLYADFHHHYWAFVVDNEEVYNTKYQPYGIDSKIINEFDFINNILIITISTPLSDIRLMEKYSVENEELFYSYPQFVYKGKLDYNKAYIHKVPRISVAYKNDEGEIVNHKLKLLDIPYDERDVRIRGMRQRPQIESMSPFKKWVWAFRIVNNI